MALKLKPLKLSNITIDDRLQMRVAIDQEHVDDIAERLADGDGFNDDAPLVVFQSGSVNLLADGFHRYHAHLKAGKKEMRCEIRQGGFQEAFKFALGANKHFSLKRSNADKRKAVTAALSDPETAKLSNRQIAEMCGVGNRFVDGLRAVSSAHGAQSAERIGRDGRTIDTSNIGKKAAEVEALPNGVDPFGPEAKAATATPIEKPTVEANRVDELEADEPPVAINIRSHLQAHTAQTAAASRESMSRAAADESVDRLGRPLEGEMLSVFEDVTTYRSMMQTLGKMANICKRLHETRAGFYMDYGIVKKSIENLKHQSRFSAPFCVCPSCNGNGGSKAEPCPTCKAAGFISEGNFTRLNKDLADIAESFGRTATAMGDAWEGEDETAAAA